jgi:glycosyltransferase involved in cell wall biosynthesis
MNEKSQPLVNIVTPVYNGEKYLADCIESVLAQTYTNWEYVIMNNCSTDGTSDIAESYALKDSRIRVVRNEKLLNMIQNWNAAMRQISPESKYCKVVHADDMLLPSCITQMTEIAEASPNVGIVGSKGNTLWRDSLSSCSYVRQRNLQGHVSRGIFHVWCADGDNVSIRPCSEEESIL